MDRLLQVIDRALAIARDLNGEKAPTRSRELSLVVTKLEEARHRALETVAKIKADEKARDEANEKADAAAAAVKTDDEIPF